MQKNYDVYRENDEFTAVCAFPQGTCGQPGGPPFSSSGWPSKELAEARINEHIREHMFGEPMTELDTFRRKHRIIVTSEGKAVLS